MYGVQSHLLGSAAQEVREQGRRVQFWLWRIAQVLIQQVECLGVLTLDKQALGLAGECHLNALVIDLVQGAQLG